MLETLRKQKRGIFGLIIVGFCGALMLPFGLDMIRSNGSTESGITVNDTKIDPRQFYNRLQQIQESFRSQLGENYPAFRKMLNLEQRTADDLVHGVLIDSYIEKVGLGANVSQIEEKIASHPFFKDTGITKSGFETFLRVQGLNSAGLEAITKREILIGQLDQLFSDFSSLSKREEESIKKIEARLVKLKYLEFKPEEFKTQVKVEDKEKLLKYFKEHSDDYLTKKAVSFSAVTFPPDDYAAQVEVDQNEIREIYEYDQSEYFTPAQVKIKQYVVNKDRFTTNNEDSKKSDADLTASTATAKEYISKIDVRLKAGEEFEKVIANDSDQPIDAGWLDYQVLEPEIRPIANSLKIGETSGVIETANYFKIIKVEDKKEKAKKTLDEVKAIIEAKIKKDNAPEYAVAAAESFMNKVSGKTISEVAEGKKVISTTQPISQGELIAGVTPNVVKKILELQEGELEIINDNDISYVVQVHKVVMPEVPAFEKVEEQVKQAVIDKEALELTKKAAEQVRDAILSGTTFEEAAALNNKQIAKSEFISKKDAAPAPFSIDSNKNIALSLNPKHLVAKELVTEGGSFYVIGFDEEKQKEEKEAEQKKEAKENELGANRIFEALIKYLKNKAEIKIDPALLEANL